MFGYMPGSLDQPPMFLGIGKDGYQFVDAMSAAALFERDDPGREGWAPPSAWAKFFQEEPELSGWRFRPVPTLRRPENRQEQNT